MTFVELGLRELEEFFQCTAVPAHPATRNLTFELLDGVQRFIFSWNPVKQDLYVGVFASDGSTLAETVALAVGLLRKDPQTLMARNGANLIEVRRWPRPSFKVSLL